MIFISVIEYKEWFDAILEHQVKPLDYPIVISYSSKSLLNFTNKTYPLKMSEIAILGHNRGNERNDFKPNFDVRSFCVPLRSIRRPSSMEGIPLAPTKLRVQVQNCP